MEVGGIILDERVTVCKGMEVVSPTDELNLFDIRLFDFFFLMWKWDSDVTSGEGDITLQLIFVHGPARLVSVHLAGE